FSSSSGQRVASSLRLRSASRASDTLMVNFSMVMLICPPTKSRYSPRSTSSDCAWIAGNSEVVPDLFGLAEKSVPVPKWKVTPSYKGESQGKNVPCDWKERKCSLRFPAHVVLRVSEDFFFFKIHLVIVTALSGSEARQAAWLKRVNHGSI